MFIFYSSLIIFLLIIFLSEIDKKFLKTRIDGNKNYYTQRRYLFFFWYDINNKCYSTIEKARLIVDEEIK
jgi:hypothetical protein